jgi:hypothetical protein
MSDEQRNEETEVEAHASQRYGANDEPGDEVEGHASHVGQSDEADDEVEGHARRAG